MKILILGSPQSGQQELFGLLTGLQLEQIRLRPLEVQPGVCEVRDPRVTRLSAQYKPKKTTYARIEYSLLPDFTTQGPARTAIFNELKNGDEICWVARQENAEADIANFVAELIINDLMLAEKRIETIEREQRRKFSEAKEKEKGLMEICKKQLEEEKPMSAFPFNDDQQKALRPYQFLTLKPLVLAINVPEDKINDRSISARVRERYPYPCVQINAELEGEISQLNEAERAEFMKEMGIVEPALERMNRIVFEGLGLISFFTVGEDEVRAWPLRKGALAPEAGNVIHSDIEKGFVRAELMKYPDLIALGSEAKVKEQGKFQLKGRDYVVEDGDILSFRFNV